MGQVQSDRHVRAPVGADRVEYSRPALPSLCRSQCERDLHLRTVRIRHESETILRTELTNQLANRSERLGHRIPSHRSRSIENDDDVGRSSCECNGRSLPACCDELHMNQAIATDMDCAAIEPSVKREGLLIDLSRPIADLAVSQIRIRFCRKARRHRSSERDQEEQGHHQPTSLTRRFALLELVSFVLNRHICSPVPRRASRNGWHPIAWAQGNGYARWPPSSVKAS